MEYNFSAIEKKWQAAWKASDAYKVSNESSKPKYFVLDMFPYPSGAGLHVGHPLGYIASDIFSRYKRLKGFNVLHPMGYDAFGLPAEQYAIEHGVHPAVSTHKNIDTFRAQLDNIGFSYDWSREIRTCDATYYKWTQWIFLQLFNSFYNTQKSKAEPILNLINEFEKNGNAVHACPSDATIQDLYNQASGYAAEAQTAEDYRALATEKGFFLRPARNLGRFEEVVSGLGSARRVVRWAWDEEREEGNIGLLENDGKGYVVVVLTDQLSEGTTPFELVQGQCLEAAKKDAKKSLITERLENALTGASTIEAVATAAGKEVRTLSFRISQFNIAGVGNEAEVVGTICGLEPGALSGVIAGDNGAFVAITSPATPAPAIDYSNMAQNTQRSIRNLVGTQAYKALEEKAKIEDMRYMMF
jgi:hypothetical protein